MTEAHPERFGPFALVEPLGAGGMGAAWLAFHSSGPPVVVKRLHRDLLHAPSILERFVHEAQVAAHVVHPNVARLVAMGAVEGEPFLATEFVFGVQLVAVVDRIEAGSTGPAPLRPALALGLQLARGLRAIHEARHRETGELLGLLHRDIGARNVMVGYDGRARIIDLGLGKSVLADWHTAHDVLAGSPDYMAPEQAMGVRVDQRADVYALAVTLWELLAGRRRIKEASVARRLERCLGARPEPLRGVRADVSRSLDALLMAAMAPDPAHRLSSAAELEAGIGRALAQSAGLPFRRELGSTEVAAWLDGALATVRARAARALSEAEERGRAALCAPGAEARFFVGSTVSAPSPLEENLPSNPPAELLREPTRMSSLVRSRPGWAVAGGFFAVMGFFAGLSSVVPERRPERVVPLVIDRPPPLAAEPVQRAAALGLPEAPGLPEEPGPKSLAGPEPMAGAESKVGPESMDARRAAPKPSPPRATAHEGRRQALVDRIRLLRRRSFEVSFQREVTLLSAQVSRARSTAHLDALERRIARLEDGS